MANKKWLADARQILIDIERIYEDYYSKSYDQCVHDIFNAMRRIVRRNASFGFVEVVHGRWIERPLDNFRKYEVKCSECGFVGIANYDQYLEPCDFNYCPNCGADMR